VWRATLDLALHADLERTLSAEERQRSARWRCRDDHERFVLTRCMVRDILSGYLNSDPAELRFLYGPRGKPALVGAEWLRFNVSHSGKVCLVAVAAHADVGVDVELLRDVDVSVLAPRALPPGAGDFAGDDDARRRMFFARWTRQEACLKAHGTGLPALGREDDPQRSTYLVVDLPIEDDYAAAVAYTSPGSRIVLQSWTATDSTSGDGDSLEGAVCDCLPKHPSARLPT